MNNKIVNGLAADPNDYPFFVSLLVNLEDTSYLTCGGFIIAPSYIITAAHCLYDHKEKNKLRKDFKNIKILHYQKALFNNNKPNWKKNNIHTIKDIILHPEYNDSKLPSFDHDIAIIKIDSKIVLNEYPIINFREEYYTPKLSHKVIGYGLTSWELGNSIQRTNILLEQDLYVIKNRIFEEYFKNNLSKNMFTLTYSNNLLLNNTTSCKGDSGGPTFIYKDNYIYITGLVSWGYNCFKKHFPGVYTKIKNYFKWIYFDNNIIDDVPLKQKNTIILLYKS